MIEGFLGSAEISNGKAVHIAELSKQSIIDCGAEHLGFGGYFLFETDESKNARGISVLARISSLDAAFAMLDLWQTRQSANI